MGPTAQRVRISRILIAASDDDTRAYRESLRSLNSDIIATSDGRQALVAALARPPTIVITDARLPLIDGYSLCEILRHDVSTRSVPILVVIGEARPAEVDRFYRAGADRVLTKPCLPTTFIAEVLRLCDPVTRYCDDLLKSARTRAIQAFRHRSHEQRITTSPPWIPPRSRCPTCDRELRYERSHIGGVRTHAEQWDDFICPGCTGVFEYRHRTRKLRRVS